MAQAGGIADVGSAELGGIDRGRDGIRSSDICCSGMRDGIEKQLEEHDDKQEQHEQVGREGNVPEFLELAVMDQDRVHNVAQGQRDSARQQNGDQNLHPKELGLGQSERVSEDFPTAATAVVEEAKVSGGIAEEQVGRLLCEDTELAVAGRTNKGSKAVDLGVTKEILLLPTSREEQQQAADDQQQQAADKQQQQCEVPGQRELQAEHQPGLWRHRIEEQQQQQQQQGTQEQEGDLGREALSSCLDKPSRVRALQSPLKNNQAHASSPDFFPGLMSQLAAASQPAQSQALFAPSDLAAFTQPLEDLERLLADPALGLQLDSDSQDSLKEAVADLREHLEADAHAAAAAAAKAPPPAGGGGVAAWAGTAAGGVSKGVRAEEGQVVQMLRGRGGGYVGGGASSWSLLQCGQEEGGHMDAKLPETGSVSDKLQSIDGCERSETAGAAGLTAASALGSKAAMESGTLRGEFNGSHGCGVGQQGGWQARDASAIPADVPPGSPLWQLLASGAVELADGPCPEWMLPSQGEEQQGHVRALEVPMTQEPLVAKQQEHYLQQQQQQQGEEEEGEGRAKGSLQQMQEVVFSLGMGVEDRQQLRRLPEPQPLELQSSAFLQELETLEQMQMEQQLKVDGVTDTHDVQRQHEKEVDKGVCGRSKEPGDIVGDAAGVETATAELQQLPTVAGCVNRPNGGLWQVSPHAAPAAGNGVVGEGNGPGAEGQEEGDNLARGNCKGMMLLSQPGRSQLSSPDCWVS
jgi:hypothetical protein